EIKIWYYFSAKVTVWSTRLLVGLSKALFCPAQWAAHIQDPTPQTADNVHQTPKI
ncbi:hypothetical protein SFRURICE_018867, partial [Spodoptera frugiperda]